MDKKEKVRQSNYEMTRLRMQKEFASRDFQKIASLWQLEYTDGGLFVELVSRRYRIDDGTGTVFFLHNGVENEADYNVAMTLYDILTRERAKASGEYSAVRNFSALHTGSMLENGFFGGFQGLSTYFDHRTELLEAACSRLGGLEFGKGDVGQKIPVFRDLSVIVQFWNSDEEFPPSFHVLLDNHVLQFMHYETAMYLISHLMDRIEEEAHGG